jgi:surface-adhesin protein E
MLDSSRAVAGTVLFISNQHYTGAMTRIRMGFFGLSTVLLALGGCATSPGTGGGLTSPSPQSAAAAPASPGPGWLLLGTHGESAVFMHPQSTLRVGPSAFIMLVASKRQPAVLPGGVTVGSLRERIKIDCERARYRRHDGTAHPDQSALGPVLGRVRQDQWRDVVPNTVMAALSLVVCSGTAPPNAAPPRAPAVPAVPPGPAAPRFHRNRGGTFST